MSDAPTNADAHWREALGARRPAAAGSAIEPAAAVTRLGLQFQLRELIPRTAHRWNGPTSRAAPAASTGREAIGAIRLGVRPVVRTARGWARQGLTWSNITHLLNRLNLDPDQYRWFCQFGALHRAAGPLVPGGDLDWIFLDEFVNDVLWAMLAQAKRLGIDLVGASAGAAAHVGGRATLSVDLAESRDGVTVRPLLTAAGAPASIPAIGARPIGDHGLYLIGRGAEGETGSKELLLVPLDEPLTPERLALLRGSGSGSAGVTVPTAAVPEFLADYLPSLREQVDVTSADGSVPLPPPAAPVLVLTATFQKKDRLDLDWRWEQPRGSAELPELVSVLHPSMFPKVGAAALTAPSYGPGATPSPASLSGDEAIEFVTDLLPLLRQLDGIRVDVVGTIPDYRERTGTPHLAISTVPTERPDWFELGITVTIDGWVVPFIPLFRALATGKRRLKMVDNTYLSLAQPALDPLRDLIEEAAELTEWETGPAGGTAQISRFQTGIWAELDDLADESQPAAEWRSLLADVQDDAPRAIDPPRGLHAELRPYQAEGFAWLAFLWRHRLGGILADDMGLGKTLQCLALVQHAIELRENETARAPFLVVAPTSVVSNWVAEAARFTPDLVVRRVTATGAASGTTVAALASGADIVVTSYALLRLDFDAYQAVATGSGWAGLILDEAQFVKNATSRVHQSAKDLAVPFRLAVTGTPMENSLTELHALFAIVAPGLFPSQRRFTEEYVRPIERPHAGIDRGRGAGMAPELAAENRTLRLARLRRRMQPFLLRRTKALVAADLPAKQEQVLTIELGADHRALYDVFLQRERRKLFGLLEDLDRNRFIVFRSLTLLRLLALDPRLLGDEYAIESANATHAKLDALMEQLDDVIAEGHRALVFSQFTSYLALVAARLDAADIQYASLDGSTRDRDAVINSFRDGTAPVFLISLKAGGFGLNLTEADYVFLLDPWWNPASEQQAIDRTHRIGQTKNVMVYRLVAADTIEEKVMALKERKAALVDAVIDDEALFSELLSADDVRSLLS